MRSWKSQLSIISNQSAISNMFFRTQFLRRKPLNIRNYPRNFAADTNREKLLRLKEMMRDRINTLVNNILFVTLEPLMTTAAENSVNTALREVVTQRKVTEGARPEIKKIVDAAREKITANQIAGLTDALTADVFGIIDSGLSHNVRYEKVAEDVSRYLESTEYGNLLHFNNVGNTYEAVRISPDGKLSLETKVIRRRMTLSVRAYVATLAHTAVKGVTSAAQIETYKVNNCAGWVYNCVSDERSRPTHIALHGRHFVYGTEESDLALKVMQDYNCRCRPSAWFNDTELDTPEAVYEQERQDRANSALHTQYLSECAKAVANNPLKSDATAMNPTLTTEQLTAIVSGRTKNNSDLDFLRKIAKVSDEECISKEMSILKENFTHQGVQHSYKHILEAQNQYNFEDILYVKNNSEYIGESARPDGISRVFFGKSRSGIPIALYIQKDGRIGTSHFCGVKCLQKLRRDCK